MGSPYCPLAPAPKPTLVPFDQPRLYPRVQWNGQSVLLLQSQKRVGGWSLPRQIESWKVDDGHPSR